MKINLFALIMLFSQILVAFSQFLLKKSASKKHNSVIKSYLNVQVITGYALLCITLLINIWAYKGLEYKVGAVLTASSYVFVMLVGRFFFDEKITKNKLIGNTLIVAGIVVFNLFS